MEAELPCTNDFRLNGRGDVKDTESKQAMQATLAKSVAMPLDKSQFKDIYKLQEKSLTQRNFINKQKKPAIEKINSNGQFHVIFTIYIK